MNRKLTHQEVEWIQIALSDQHKEFGLDINDYLSQISSLRVIEECDCGDPTCHSVRFQNYEAGNSHGFADGTAKDKDNKAFMVTLFVNSATNMISELETM